MELEKAIDTMCQKLDETTDLLQRRIIEAELFALVEQLNGNTIYLTVQ
jgi:hypothetical protein